MLCFFTLWNGALHRPDSYLKRENKARLVFRYSKHSPPPFSSYRWHFWSTSFWFTILAEKKGTNWANSQACWESGRMYKLKRRKLLLLLVGVAWAWFYLYRGRGGSTPSSGQQERAAVCGQTDRLNISSPRIIFGRHQPLACKIFHIFFFAHKLCTWCDWWIHSRNTL
jgi:hypothetical protein